MANGVIQEILRLKDEATPELQHVAKAAGEAADAQGRATKAAGELGQAHGRLAKSAQEAASQERRLGDETDRLGDRAGRVGSSAARMAGALSMISPEAAQAAFVVNDLADVAEVATQAAGGLGISLTSVLTVLGPIALAVGATALAWKYYSGELEKAEAKMKTAAEAADKMADATGRLQRTTADLELMSAVMAGEADPSALKAREAQLQAEAAYAETRALQEERVAAVTREIEERRKAILELERDGVGIADGELERRRELVTTQAKAQVILAQQQEVLAGIDTRTANAAATLLEWSMYSERGAKGLDKAGKSTADLADESADLEASWQQIAAYMAGDPVGMLEPGAVRDMIEAGAAIQTKERAAERAALADRLAAVSDALAEWSREQEEQSAKADALRQVRRAALLDEAAGEKDKRNKAVATAAEITSGVVTGDVSGLLGMLPGPAGAIGGALDAISSMGEDPGAVLEQVQGWMDGLMAGLQALPQFLPELVSMLVGDLPLALIEAMPDLVAGLIEAAPQILGTVVEAIFLMIGELFLLPFRIGSAVIDSFTGWWVDIGGFGGITEAIADWWRDVWDVIREALRQANPFNEEGSVGGFFADLAEAVAPQFPRYDVGGYVPRTGMALLHQGERVVPPTGAGTQAAGRGGGGGGDVHVHISGFAVGSVDQLVAELNRHLGTRGRGLAWAAGS